MGKGGKASREQGRGREVMERKPIERLNTQGAVMALYHSPSSLPVYFALFQRGATLCS